MSQETPAGGSGGFQVPPLGSLLKKGPGVSRRRGPKSGPDAAVQDTNDDACVSKLSAVKLGYFQDQFLHFFNTKGSERRSPLMNRGYFARYYIIDTAVRKFLDLTKGKPRAIVVLGAGYDTTYFRLKAEGIAPEKYLEVDFPEVTARKAEVIFHNDALRGLLEAGLDVPPHMAPGEITSSAYNLISCDLRQLDQVEAAIKKAGLDPGVPTLFLSECVLIYMRSQDSAPVLKHVADTFPNGAFVSYEQILPNDPFGQQMLKNLEMRGCPLLGIHDYPTAISQQDRFLGLGWHRAVAVSMKEVYEQCIDPSSLARVSRIEVFDEFEEWGLIMSHYAVTVAVTRPNTVLESMCDIERHQVVPSFNTFID